MRPKPVRQRNHSRVLGSHLITPPDSVDWHQTQETKTNPDPDVVRTETPGLVSTRQTEAQATLGVPLSPKGTRPGPGAGAAPQVSSALV